MLSVCLCLPPINLWMPKPIFMKLAVYIMAPEPNLNDILHKSLPWVCAFLYVVRQRLSKNVTATTNTHETTEELLDASFSMQSMSHERRVCGSVYHLSLLGKGLVSVFQRQRGIVGGVIFRPVRVVSNRSRRLVLSRTSCNFLDIFGCLVI
jgi:hypothetical protein